MPSQLSAAQSITQPPHGAATGVTLSGQLDSRATVNFDMNYKSWYRPI